MEVLHGTRHQATQCSSAAQHKMIRGEGGGEVPPQIFLSKYMRFAHTHFDVAIKNDFHCKAGMQQQQKRGRQESKVSQTAITCKSVFHVVLDVAKLKHALVYTLLPNVHT